MSGERPSPDAVLEPAPPEAPEVLPSRASGAADEEGAKAAPARAPEVIEVGEGELGVPDYPPPESVPRPPPPIALKTFPPPRVDDLSPARGSVLGGTRVTLVGASLFRATIVRIGGVIAQTVGADEPRELRILAPAAPHPGEVDVTVENPFVPPLVLPRAFRYDPLVAPRIDGVAPDHVSTRGGEVTLTGEGFVKSTAVIVDGKPAQSVRFVSATTLDVNVPAGDDGKLVDVSVKNPDGQAATARRAFIYDRRFG